MRFNVLAVSKSPDAYTTVNGTFQPFTLFGTFDDSTTPEYAVIHAKAGGKEPRQGESIECTADSVPVDIQVKDRTVDAKRIRRVSPYGSAQAPRPSQAASLPQESPDRQSSIERQNSLTNAVGLCVARSVVSLAAGQHDEAAACLDEGYVTGVAAILAAYNAGKAIRHSEAAASPFGDDPGPSDGDSPF